MDNLEKFKEIYIRYDLFIKEIEKISKILDEWISMYKLSQILKLETEKIPDESYCNSLIEVREICKEQIKEKKQNKEIFDDYVQEVKKGIIDLNKLDIIKNIANALEQKTDSIKDFLEKLLIIMKEATIKN